MKDLEKLWTVVAQNASKDDVTAIMHFLQGINAKQQGEYTRYINATLHMHGEFYADHSIISIPNSLLIQNSIQVPHGGILATIADAAMGGLASRAAPLGKNVVTTNLTMNYIATTTAPILYAKGTFIHRGNKTFVMQCTIEDSYQRRLATSSATFFVIDKRT